MKTLFITIALLLTATLNSNELAWVDEQVEAIKPPRTGMSSREISVVRDPFIFLAKNREIQEKDKEAAKKTNTQPTSNKVATSSKVQKTIKKKKALSLTMLINSSALINGKWYKQGDTVKGYKISKINSKSVLLTKKNKKLLLSTISKNENLNFKNQ